MSRSGQNSFTIVSKEGETRAVHIAQLNPYFDDVLEGGVLLHHYRPDNKDPASITPQVDEILSHRTDLEVVLWFLVRWFGADSRDDTWNRIKELLEINDRDGSATVPATASHPFHLLLWA